jgi:precorrin-6B methylase 2
MSSDYQADIFALTDAITPWAVRAAATLRLADLISAGTTSLPDLAAKAHADPDALRRLMRYLTVRGVFAETEPGVYALTPAADMLREDHPAGRRTWWDVDGVAGRIEGSFIRLKDAICTGEAAYPLVYGQPFYEDMATNPERARSFNALMATHASYFGQIVSGYDWSGVKHVFDIGGGTGALLTEILRGNPGMNGTLVDLPGVVEEAEEALAAAGIADRAAVVGGSIFQRLPAGGDLYVLSNVLHDWGDDKATEILRRAAEAAGSDGRVLVVQILVDMAQQESMDPGELYFITQMDLRLLSLMGGKERTYEEFVHLAANAGLKPRSRVKVPAGQTLMEFETA